jgi:hypothetical protein
MSSEQVSPSGTETELASGETAPSKEDKVAYSTYQKVLAEKKSRDQQLEQALAKLKDLEHKELEAKGKDKELIEALRKEVQTERESKIKVAHSFATKAIREQVLAAGKEHGCADPEWLFDKVNKGALQVNEETFEVNAEDLKREIEAIMKVKPQLFNKQGPRVNDLPLTSKGPVVTPEKKKMSIEEMARELAKLNNKQ